MLHAASGDKFGGTTLIVCEGFLCLIDAWTYCHLVYILDLENFKAKCLCILFLQCIHYIYITPEIHYIYITPLYMTPEIVLTMKLQCGINRWRKIMNCILVIYTASNEKVTMCFDCTSSV